MTHTYTSPGTYTVTLTVTDSASCGPAFSLFSGEAGPFTGQTAACSPDTAATTSQTVTIPAAPETVATPGPGPGSAGIGKVTIKAKKLTSTITCKGTATQTCKGTLALTTIEHLTGHKVTAITAAKTKKPKKTTRTVTLGRATYTLNGGGTRTLTITLSGTGAQLLAAHHKLPVKLSITPTGSKTASSSRTVTIKAPKASRKR